MYLGKPQIKHPMYEVSPLSTNKKLVYTIKPEFTNQTYINDFVHYDVKQALGDKQTASFLDRDGNMFGTMGGFN
ncbi:MAG: hypothetical protein ACOH2V_00065 [Candidatus Saccharimonadaceae bacterium]